MSGTTIDMEVAECIWKKAISKTEIRYFRLTWLSNDLCRHF